MLELLSCALSRSHSDITGSMPRAINDGSKTRQNGEIPPLHPTSNKVNGCDAKMPRSTRERVIFVNLRVFSMNECSGLIEIYNCISRLPALYLVVDPCVGPFHAGP